MATVTFHYRQDSPEQIARNRENFCRTVEHVIKRTYGMNVKAELTIDMYGNPISLSTVKQDLNTEEEVRP